MLTTETLILGRDSYLYSTLQFNGLGTIYPLYLLIAASPLVVSAQPCVHSVNFFGTVPIFNYSGRTHFCF